MSYNIQDIQSNLQSLENQINAAELCEQVIPKVLEILEEYGREIEALHGTQDVKETWKRVYSYCINVEINELDKRIQSLSPNSSPQEVRQLLQLHASLSGRGHLSESQQRFLKDLQDVIKQMSETLGAKEASPSHPQEILPDRSGLGILSYLPDEAVATIVSFLTLEDLCRLNRLSKEFKSFSSDKMFWNPLASAIAQKELIRNLKNGFFTSKTILENLFVSGLQVAEGRLFLKSADSIMVFDLKTMGRLDDEPIWNLFCFQISDNHLFSENGDIEIWDLKTMKLVSRLGVYLGVYSVCMQVKGDLLFAGFLDGRIKIWNWKTQELLHDLKIHDSSVKCLQVEDDVLFSSDDHNINVMNLKTGQNVTNLRQIPNVNSFQVAGDLVVLSIGKSGSIAVMNWKTNQSIASSVENNDAILCMEVVGNLVFSGHKDGTIKVRDLKTLKCLAKFQGSQGPVDCLQFIGGRLFLGSCHENGGLEILDFNVTRSQVIAEIAAELKTGNLDFEHFDMFPKEIKEAVYDQLSLITSFEADYPGCAEDAFLKRNGLSTTNEKRMQAIQNYLVGHIMQLLEQNKIDEAVQEFEHLPKEIQQVILAQNMTDEQRNQLESKYKID